MSITSEIWWTREIVTAELDHLGDTLVSRTGRPATAFGAKGNTAHLRGGHRSQEWILNSEYVSPKGSTYTVQSGLTAEQLRHIAAADWTPGVWGTAANRALMVAITKRLVTAMRAGQLSGVREVIGTLDGKTVHGERADGSTFSADDSHLDHVHLTFDRRRMRDAALMAKVADLIVGDEMLDLTQQVPIDDKTTTLKEWFRIVSARTNYLGNVFTAELRTRLDALLVAAQNDGDTTVVLAPEALAELAAITEAVKAVPAETAELVHADLAD